MIRQLAPWVLVLMLSWGLHPSTRFDSSFWLLLIAVASMLLIVLPVLRSRPGDRS